MASTQMKFFGGKPQIKRPSINPLILVVLVLAIAVIGGGLVLRFIGIEQGRELLSWQNRLTLIADSRASDIDGWLERHFREMDTVTTNPSLQLYLTELMTDPEVKDIPVKDAPVEDPAQVVFLRNLLSITADRLGFVEKASKEIKSIDANVRQPSGVGIAIVDNNGKVLVSTGGLPSLSDDLGHKIEQMPKGQQGLIDIFTAENGANRIGFVLPIYSIQSDNSANQQIGRLVGIKNVDKELSKLLHHPGVTEKTLEAVLLRKEGSNVDYLLSQEGGKAAAAKLALDTPDLDAAFALTSPGAFAEKKDAQSQSTLMTSRALVHAPWVLLLHIDRNQAMADSDAWLRQIEYSLLFAVLAMIGGVVAVWYYGTTRRVMLLSLETKRMADRSAAQERLLRVVSDNQLDPIVIADESNIARFANAKAAKGFGIDRDDVAGKDLPALMGATYAKGGIEANRIALLRKAPYVRTWTMEAGKGTTVIRSEHIPLEHIPVEGLPMPSPGVLMIDQDITEIVNEREHHARVLRQLVDMLVHMVDRRDPFAASHSACVSLLARAVALGMGLDPQRVETAELAGSLMNIGKIVVPAEVLTKASSLTDDEMKSIRDSLQSSIALLEKIEFEGPVVDTLRQSQERYNGTGPLGLRGEEILVTARIIAVANAFVGMVSPRSYRQALPIDQAIRTLLGKMETEFDRRVVVALADFVENRQGRDAVMKLVTK